ncbi:protein O-mannosyl-transferase TMTC1, partial [Hyalella azteca]|uniref:Protein O-mannosyl-transferase TMTC1 n=1 Tax=Hyalella azteca TaxID=294128 RepID=A0A8B7P1V8_HYAAZ
MGYCLLLSAGLQRCRRLQAPLLLLLLLLFGARTVRRNVDWQSREALFTAGLRTMPYNAKMHYNYGNLQRDLFNTDLAQLHYREAIRLWPDHASAHNNLGTLLNDTRMAEAHFRAALHAHPHHAHASYNLAMLRQKEGARAEAISLLEASLRYDVSHRDSVCALAELYVLDGRDASADALHRELLLAVPRDAAAHNNYAAFLQRAGRKEAALGHYETALSLDPEHSIALVNTARLLRALKHDQHAEILYRRALSVSWEAGVGESLGKLYLNTDRLQEAHETFSAVLQRFPHRISTRVYLARVQLQQRQYEATEAILTSVLNEDPSYPEALLQLSLLYAHTNRTAQALEVASAAADHCSVACSVCAHLLAHRADLLHAAHRTDAAQKSYEAALEFDSTLSHAHVNLGAIFHSKGEFARAWHHYLNAQTHDPTNTLLLENMEKLKRSPHLMHPLTPLNCLTIS